LSASSVLRIEWRLRPRDNNDVQVRLVLIGQKIVDSRQAAHSASWARDLHACFGTSYAEV
jgi:hypothetical protein